MTKITDDAELLVRFWGVRGSIATSGPETVRYGGNTSCIEVLCGGRRIIFDAGTGLRKLGKAMMKEQGGDVDIFLSHTHLDHIVGVPFFVPFHLRTFDCRIWAGHLLPDRTLKSVLGDMMQAPLFPIPPETFRGNVEFKDFECGDDVTPADGITLRTAPLNHPNGATGYRLEFAGRSICYVTDTEHFPDGRDETIVDLVRDSDVMIYDATYSDEEYKNFAGFGHSTWEEGARIAQAANVKTYAVFHHDPSHDDAFMDQVGKEVAEMWPGSVVCYEGMELRV